MSNSRINPVLILLSLVSIILLFGKFRSGYFLNRANLAILHWITETDLDRAELALRTALDNGRKANKTWMQSHWAKKTEALLEQTKSQNVIKARQAAATYQNGLELERQNKTEHAFELYLESCWTDNNIYRVQACYAASTKAQLLALPELFNETYTHLSTLQPEYTITDFSIDNFELIGYDLDELNLDRGTASILISIYWRVRDIQDEENISEMRQWDKNGWNFLQVGERLYQFGLIDNLFPNSGFEINNPELSPLPIGYQDIAYNANMNQLIQAQRHRVEIIQRGQTKSSVAVIVNENANLNGITTIQATGVSQQKIYLLGGWMMVKNEGRGYLGGVWRDQKKEDILYWYPAEDVLDQDWQFVTGAQISPPSAELFSLLVLNRGLGEIFVDNLFLFQIPKPALSEY